MGTLYTFRFFDGRVEYVRDGGMGKTWVVEFANRYYNIAEIWQVSCNNNIETGNEFFKTIHI